jgi:ferric-dicitrate binding protein FerR (iron transport regulator)
MRGGFSLLLALSCLLNGCTSWKTQEVAPATYIQSNRPERVRLTLQDSTRLTLQTPTAVGDSIIGTFPKDSTRHAVPVSEVRSFEARRPSAGKTVGLVVGIAAGTFTALAVTFVIGMSIECPNGCN